MGAIHQVNATYYGGSTAVSSGHPDDDLGFAVGAGLRLNAPMIGQGDYLQAQINYTQGALRYIFQTPNSNYGKVEGADLGFGVLSDAVYGGTIVAGNASQLNLTTAWNVNAAYRALLESAVADLALRRLCRGELQRTGQQDPLLVAGRRRW